ncbi:hypothetical protein SOVF_077070 [Spinacia oleracea]|nr:hypothetical protein SOVF_077070 [Spinacia oleracea]
MQKLQAKPAASALAMFFLLATFAPDFSVAVSSHEALWLLKPYKEGGSTRKMIVLAGGRAQRSLRTKTPSYLPSPEPGKRMNPLPPSISEKLL